jgi:hypothetical protein
MVTDFRAAPALLFSPLFSPCSFVSLVGRYRSLPAFIVNFCLKIGPDARKGFPVSRCAATPLRGPR